jgi:nitrate/nitrite transporter NarK
MGFSSSWWGLLFSMISESIPHENVGLALGILNTLGPLGFAILAPIYGSLVDISGGYFFSNTIILIGGAIMTVIYIFFTKETYGGIGHTRVTVQSHKT